MFPYTDQLLRWKASDPERKIGGLVLEVKGDFCQQVHGMLTRAGRASDYTEIRLGGDVCYNPLHNDLDPYAVAYAVSTLVNNLFGKSKEPFWQQAYTDLLKFVILLRRLADGYTTLAEVYRYVLEDGKIEAEITKLKAALSQPPEVVVVPLANYELQDLATAGWRDWFQEVQNTWRGSTAPTSNHIYRNTRFPTRYAERRGPRGSIGSIRSKRWTDGSRTAGNDSTIACGPQSQKASSSSSRCLTRIRPFTGRSVLHEASTPVPEARAEAHFLRSKNCSNRACTGAELPGGLNPGLARAVGVMLKLDFQRAVIQRIPKITAHPERIWRDLLFVCDEYHAFATVGETDPTGDERTFALSRQARLIPIVATQSISSLRSALPGDESWRTLLQCFRTKLFLATSDEFTARAAADLCGRRDRLKAHYTLSEGGQSAHISLLTGRATAAKQTVSASKSYAPHHEYIFSPRVFTELQNGQAIALPYDGLNPMPPQFCYLKPHYLDVQTSYFDQVARGQL
jgi:hypothetical protein